MERVTGKETAEEMHVIILGIVRDMTSKIHGTPERRQVQVVVMEEVCCQLLSQVLFNRAFAQSKGDVKMIPTYMLAHMDDIKEKINDYCAENLVLFNNNQIRLANDEHGQPVKIKK